MTRNSFLTLLLFSISFIGKGQVFSENAIPGLPGLGNSSVAWGDFNNDAYLDFAISGVEVSGNVVTAIYKNNGNSSFSFLASLDPVHSGSISVGDLNHDGRVDLFVTGLTSSATPTAFLYLNHGNFSFAKHSTLFEGVRKSASAFADFDNDGDLDISYAGITATGTRMTYLLKNNLTAFTSYAVSMPGISDGSLSWADFNNDSRPDFLLTGLLDNGNRISNLYKNKGDSIFEKINTVFEKIAYGEAAWGDYDENGLPDIVLSGVNGSGTKVSKVYKNMGNDLFTDINVNFQPLSNSSVALGDFDNDGKTDVFLSGLNNSNAYTFLYKNKGNDNFEEVTSGLLGVFDGNSALADFDQDGDLDILLAGFNNFGAGTKLFTNTTSNPNAKPSAPQSLAAFVNEGTVSLSWIPSSDAETSAKGLIYNFYLGSISKGIDKMSPSADTISGSRRIAINNFYSHSTQLILDNLPEGKYYWAVQAIDPGHSSSLFSAESSFNICYKISAGDNKVACVGETVRLTMNEPKAGDQIKWFSHSNPTVSIASGAEASFVFHKTDTVWVEVTREIGCILRDTVIIKSDEKTKINLADTLNVCIGESTRLGGNPTAQGSKLGYRYSWYPADNLDDPASPNPIASPRESRTYRLIVSTGACVLDTNYVFVKVNPLPVVRVSNDVTIGFMEEAQLSASGGVFYQWTPPEGLNFDNIAEPVALPEKTTLYKVIVTDANGCQSTDSIKVTVSNDFFVPNLFTPNGDGRNDFFKAYGFGVKNISFTIYDDLNQVVFQTSDLNQAMSTGWDGTLNGTSLPSGTFFWTVKGKYYDGKDLNFKGKSKGSFKLIR